MTTRSFPLWLGLGCLVPAVLHAQTLVNQSTFGVTGYAPQVCTLQPGRIQPGGLVNLRGLDGDTLQIEQLTDPQTLAVRATSATIDFAATCNYAHRLRVETQNNGLWPTDGAMGRNAPGFAYALPYNASISWAGRSTVLQADAKVRRLNQQILLVSTAATGQVELRLQMDAGASNTRANAPVLAGVYGDTLRIYVEPQ
ncbi:MAG: hypothetical protein KGJ57_22725 [Sphingomonadales bacterium]|nr:hypothetical protein [Sphingomonadales bacterium]MDE2172200.1 hypothetical protein [Sphingomonadales bacterium]